MCPRGDLNTHSRDISRFRGNHEVSIAGKIPRTPGTRVLRRAGSMAFTFVVSVDLGQRNIRPIRDDCGTPSGHQLGGTEPTDLVCRSGSGTSAQQVAESSVSGSSVIHGPMSASPGPLAIASDGAAAAHYAAGELPSLVTRKLRVRSAIWSACSSRAKWPPSSRCTSAPGTSRL